MEEDCQGKRPRYWLRALVVTIAVVVVWPVVLVTYNWWSSHRNLEDTLAYLEAEGVPLEYSEFRPKPFDPKAESFVTQPVFLSLYEPSVGLGVPFNENFRDQIPSFHIWSNLGIDPRTTHSMTFRFGIDWRETAIVFGRLATTRPMKGAGLRSKRVGIRGSFAERKRAIGFGSMNSQRPRLPQQRSERAKKVGFVRLSFAAC